MVEGVRGGVVMPICILGLGDTEFDNGDGILYLKKGTILIYNMKIDKKCSPSMFKRNSFNFHIFPL